jgi:hypothetical protein
MWEIGVKSNLSKLALPLSNLVKLKFDRLPPINHYLVKFVVIAISRSILIPRCYANKMRSAPIPDCPTFLATDILVILSAINVYIEVMKMSRMTLWKLRILAWKLCCH